MTDPDVPGFGPVLVVGAGLMGTSVGLALRRHGVEVYLRDRSPMVARVAASLGAGSDHAPHAAPRLVVVAVPPDHLGEAVAAALREWPRAYVTDIGSVKVKPLTDAAGLGAELRRYVGGHPMAGSERSGPIAGSADLFDGRAWAVTPHPEAAADGVAAVHWLVRRCGAVLVSMSPAEHDQAVARISHLPHVLAVLAAARLPDAPAQHLALSGAGLRDVTRVAGGDPALWRQILTANAPALTDLLRQVRTDLEALIDSLATSEHQVAGADLEALLHRGSSGAATIPAKHGGPVRADAPVFVLVPDQPGELARLFADTGAVGVNIEDIRIDHDPARPAGLVELTVAADSAGHLVQALDARGWTIHR